MLNSSLWSQEQMTAMLANKKAYLGAWGEQWLMGVLKSNGYTVSNAHVGEKRGDLRVVDTQTGEVLQVEVKTARAGKDGRYRFCLRKKGHTDISHADFVALLCVNRWGSIDLYLAPVAAFGELKNATIGKSGKHDAFKVSAKNIRLGVQA